MMAALLRNGAGGTSSLAVARQALRCRCRLEGRLGARGRLGRLFMLLCLAATMQTDRAAHALGPAKLEGHGGPIKSVWFNADGTIALSAGFDYSIIRWSIDGERGVVAHRFLDHEAAVNDIVIAPNGTRAISVSDDGTVGVWDLTGNRLLARLTGHAGKVVGVAVSSNGKLAASAGWDHTARVWNIETLQPVAVLKGHRGNVNSVAFSADGKTLYTASYDGTVRSWDIARASELRTLYRHGWGLNVIRMLPDGGHLLFGGLDGKVGTLDVATGEVAKILQPFDGPVLAGAVWPRHNLVAAGGAKGIIRLWALDTFELKEEYENPNGPVWSLAISGDGTTVYYSGLDDFVTGWQISPRRPFEPVAGLYPRRFQLRDDMGPGELQFARKCSVCHTLTPAGGNRAGPTLYKLFGRKAGSLPGYVYSEALKDSDIVWTEATIARLFDEGPDKITPGSKMPLQRLRSHEERDALIAYLKRATETGEPIVGREGKRSLNETGKTGETQ